MKKRIIIAGVASGCGKTTITIGILKALQNRGINVTAFKCGCDYIDGMFHEKALGIQGGNVDTYLYNLNTVRELFESHSGDLSIIEGVMGFYDGETGSTFNVSKTLDCPVILVVNARGAETSVLPVIKGFLDWNSENHIVGVILNNAKAETFQKLKSDIEKLGVLALGSMPKLTKELTLESRHLGLVTATEIENIKDIICKIAAIVEQNIDIGKLIELSNNVKQIEYVKDKITPKEPVTIAVSKDCAFCFSYRENIEILEKLGAKIKFFSPLNDKTLPKCDGLYLVGGYPELHLDEIELNVSMKHHIKNAIENGLPTIAECGGFMFLHSKIDGREMVGAINGECYKTDKLVRFGYANLTAKEDNLLLAKGDSIRSHEFHYYESENCGTDVTAEKLSGKTFDCVIATKSLFAGFPHLAFYSNINSVKRFVDKCVEYKKKFKAGLEK